MLVHLGWRLSDRRAEIAVATATAVRDLVAVILEEVAC
jgi:hypothetical protein